MCAEKGSSWRAHQLAAASTTAHSCTKTQPSNSRYGSHSSSPGIHTQRNRCRSCNGRECRGPGWYSRGEAAAWQSEQQPDGRAQLLVLTNMSMSCLRAQPSPAPAPAHLGRQALPHGPQVGAAKAQAEVHLSGKGAVVARGEGVRRGPKCGLGNCGICCCTGTQKCLYLCILSVCTRQTTKSHSMPAPSHLCTTPP